MGCFFYNFNIVRTHQGYSFKSGFDGLSLILIISTFIFSFVFIAIVKLLSVKINRFIYESYASISYIAFNFVTADWIVNLLGPLREQRTIWFEIMCDSSIIIQLILCTLVIYYFWKYRLEISLGIFIGRILQSYGIATKILAVIFSIKPTNREKFYLVSAIVIIFIALTILLRKLNVYDFRSRKDKWLETTGEGPYKVWAKNRCA